MKTCRTCKEIKPLDCYYPKRRVCKVCRRAYHLKNYRANRERCMKKSKEWKIKNRDKTQAYRKMYQKKNRAHAREYERANSAKINKRRRERTRTDPVFATTRRLRARVGHWLKGSKSTTTEELVGCTFEECKRWLESQFVDGMSWENKDKWHIDHMMPLKSFNILDSEQQRIACHYTNLQPLWGPENESKGSKIVYDMIWREHWYIKIDGEYVSRLNLGRLGRTRS